MASPASSASSTSAALLGLRRILEPRLERRARSWLKESAQEVAGRVSGPRFSALLSLASRQARPRAALLPTDEERALVARAVPGVEIERWGLLETVRVVLVLSRADLAEESGALAVEEAFRYADEGETRALYRALAFLPGGERFLARVRQGCRTNMLSVFEAAVLDTPYPARWFDEVAWNQVAIKAIFVGAPLWRLVGLDERLSEELARMALDLADERRSAGRVVQHELWLLLGRFGGERALDSLAREVAPGNPDTVGRAAAVLGLARAGAMERLGALAAGEREPAVRRALENARAGQTDQTAFRALEELAQSKA